MFGNILIAAAVLVASSIPAMPSPGARSEQSQLQRLSGRNFDRDVRRFMMERHQKNIALFRARARSGEGATAGYAAASIPVREHHLSVARSLRG